MQSDLIFCEKCGYPRRIGVACTACPPVGAGHIMADTPANRAALEPLAVQLYNSLGEMQKQFLGARTSEQRAAQREVERLLGGARMRAEARCNESAMLLACDAAPGPVAEALRTVGPCKEVKKPE